MSFRVNTDAPKTIFLSGASTDTLFRIVDRKTPSVNSFSIKGDGTLKSGNVGISSDPNSQIYNMILPPTIPTPSQSLAASSIVGSDVQLSWLSSGVPTSPNVVTVFKGTPVTGQYYNTLTDAVAYINTQSPSTTNRWTINILAGTYTEVDTVTIPSYVTVTGDFGLSVIIKTSGLSHVLKASNRCDIYNLTIQGPTSNNCAGIFADDSSIGFFVGNCRIVSCYYGLLLKPATNKTLYAYTRGLLFNSNTTNQLLIDNTNVGVVSNVFSWANIYYAESTGLLIDTYGPLVRCTGNNLIFRSMSDDFERDQANVTGTGIQIENQASVILSSPLFNWLVTAIYNPNDATSSNIVVNSPTFTTCTINISIQSTTTIGYLDGNSSISKTITAYGSAWYVESKSRNIIVIELDGSGDFSDLQSAIQYVSTYSPTPSGTNRFVIQLGVEVFNISGTQVIPDYCDLIGYSFEQTSIIITVQNTTALQAGYNCIIQDLSIYGYNTNPTNPDFFTSNGTTGGYAILYSGTSTYTNIGYVQTVQIGNFYKSIGAITGVGLYNILQVSDIRFLGYRNTHTHIDINAGSGGATSVGLNGIRFSPTYVNGVAGNYQYFANVTGASPAIVNTHVFNNIVCRSGGTDDGTPSGNPLKYGYGININQGSVDLRNSFFKQYDKGIVVPSGSTNVNITALGTTATICNNSLYIDSVSTTGSIMGNFDISGMYSISTGIGILVLSTGQGTLISGGLYQSSTSQIIPNTTNQPSNISPQLNQAGITGPISGGTITITGGRIYVTSGKGYLMVGTAPNDTLTYITFAAQDIAVVSNDKNYVYIDNTSTLRVSSSALDETTNIHLGNVVTSGTNALYIDQVTDALGTSSNIRHLSTNINVSLEEAFGGIVNSGLIATNTGTQLAVSQGIYYVGSTKIQPAALALGFTFKGLWFGGGSIIGWNTNSLTNVPMKWNNAGTLTNLTAGQFAKHSLYITGDSTNQTAFFVYGTQTFVSANAADSGSSPTPPSFFGPNTILIASIVTDDTSIQHILDQRPTLVSRTGTVTSTNNHSNLINLNADDHLQYFRTDGSRLMTGNINTNNNNIIVGTGTVDGVTVHAHASRHIPGGADPLPTAAVITIGTANAEGVAGSFARSDHVHNHGAQTDPSLHALATGSNAGFLSSANYTLLANATSNPTASTLVSRDASRDTNVRLLGVVDPTTFTNKVTVGAQTGTGNWALSLPTSAGSSGQFLQTNGSGVSTWSPAVTNVATSTGLTGGPITTTGTISLANTAVTPGTYNIATITVDQQGRITSASTGNLTGDTTSVGLATTQVMGKVTYGQSTVNQTTSSTSLIDITSLSGFSLSASSTYYFRFSLQMLTSAGNRGYQISTVANGAITSINYLYTYPTSSSSDTNEQVVALQSGTITTTGPGNTRRSCRLEGSIVTSGAITFGLQFRSDDGVGSVTIGSGSLAYIQKIV